MYPVAVLAGGLGARMAQRTRPRLPQALPGVSGRQGLMTVFRNCDAWDSSNVALREGLVAEYRKGAAPGTYEYIDYGMSILTAGAFAPFPPGTPFDLARVLQSLIAAGELAAFEVEERF